MIQLAINILWLLIGVVILLGVVWLALYLIELFTAIPDVIKKMVWAVVLLLILIAILSLLAGGGSGMRSFHLGESSPAYSAGPAACTQHLPGVLSALA